MTVTVTDPDFKISELDWKSFRYKRYVGPFVLSQKMRHTNFPLGAPKRPVLGGGQKVYVENAYVLFLALTVGSILRSSGDAHRTRVDGGNKSSIKRINLNFVLREIKGTGSGNDKRHG